MGHYRPCDLCENDPQKKKGLSQDFSPSKWCLLPGSVNSSLLPSVHFSSQDTSSLSLPRPCSPSTSLSSLVVWADPQSISPQRQPQKNNVYCIYNIYILYIYGSYGSQSHSPHGVLPTFLPNPQIHLFIVQFIRRATSSHHLGNDGDRLPLPLWPRGSLQIWYQNCAVTFILFSFLRGRNGFWFTCSRAARLSKNPSNGVQTFCIKQTSSSLTFTRTAVPFLCSMNRFSDRRDWGCDTLHKKQVSAHTDDPKCY